MCTVESFGKLRTGSSGSANYHTEPEGSVLHAELNNFIFHLSGETGHAYFIFAHGTPPDPPRKLGGRY
jgi:hypothetical protein